MIEEFEGVAIDVSRVGKGSPTVIFVHGLGCDGNDWHRQVNLLAQKFECVTFDLPGHGLSGLPATGALETLARTLGGMIERYGAAGCVLVGHSLGCRLILEALSLASPSTCRSIRAIAFLEQSLVAGSNEAAVASTVSGLALRIDAVGIHDFLRPAFAAMFVPGSDLALKERVLARLDRLDGGFARELLLGATHWEKRARAQLERLEMPVLLVQSTYLDGQFQWHRLEAGRSTPWIDLVRNSVSDCEVEILCGSGHFSPIEAADAVNKRLLGFLERARALGEDSRVRG